MAHATEIQDLIDGLELLGDWQERYRYIIDLGRKLAPMPESEKIDGNLVKGCTSRVWLTSHIAAEGPPPRLGFRADSDSHIMKGLVSVLLMMYGDKTADEILTVDSRGVFKEMGLDRHLSPLRSNGLASLDKSIRTRAEALKAGA